MRIMIKGGVWKNTEVRLARYFQCCVAAACAANTVMDVRTAAVYDGDVCMHNALAQT